VAAIVMMILAIPFAIHSQRRGGTGAKIVLGILLGLGSTSPAVSSRTSDC